MFNFPSIGALALALCAIPAVGADFDALLRANWVQAETKHFRVVSDQKGDTARQLVNDLERMRHFSLRALGMEALEGIAPLTVLAIGDPDLFRKVGLPENSAGEFSTSLRGYAAIAAVDGYIGDGDQLSFARTSLLHEYHHFLVRMTLQTVTYPMWCDEGMAEYFSSFRYDNSTVRVGDIDEDAGRVEGLYSPGGALRIDSRTLFNTVKLDYTGNSLANKSALNAFYARAGFVIHYFNSSSELRAQLADYLRLYNLGIGQDRAVQFAFKRSYVQLDKDIAQYLLKRLSARVFKSTEGPFKFPPVDIKVEALDGRHVAAALAGVLPLLAVPPEAVAAALARNLRENANSAQASIDVLRFSPGGYSMDQVRALGERFPVNPQLLTMLGELMHERAAALRATDMPGAMEELRDAREQFRRAVLGDPSAPAPYHGLGQVYLGLPDSEPLGEGIDGFDTASIYEPSPENFRGVATLALRAKHPDVAVAALRHAVTTAIQGGYSEDALLLDNLEMLDDLNSAAPTPTPDGLAYKSGARYVGQVRALKPEGAGKLERFNGSYIEGSFRDGLPLSGKLVSERGGEYEGQFSAGVAGGRGALRYPAGAPALRYVGEVALGKPDGSGVLTGPRGRYEGGFLNGEAHGEGGFTPAAKAVTMRGKWLYGRYVWPAGDGEVFVGEIDAKGEPSGAGYCYGTAANSELRRCQRGGDQGKAAALSQ